MEGEVLKKVSFNSLRGQTGGEKGSDWREATQDGIGSEIGKLSHGAPMNEKH